MACWTLVDVEIDNSITLLAPPWGSAVEGGVNHGGPRFAQKSRSQTKLSIKTLGARWLARRSQAVESTTVSHFWLPHGGLQLRVGESMVAQDSLRNRALARSCPPKHLQPIWRAGRSQTLKSMTVSQFWLPQGGLQLRVGETMVAQDSLRNRALGRRCPSKHLHPIWRTGRSQTPK